MLRRGRGICCRQTACSRSWRGIEESCFPDESFADLFRSARGRPSVPADVVARVIMLQSLHVLSGREAAEAVTFDLRWKAAVGLAMEATSFHPTTLTYWRRRLAASDRPNRIFEVVRQVVAETGVLKGKTRRALDSTVLDDAVATQDTVTQLIAAIRRVRRDVPDAAAVIGEVCSAHDYDDPGKPTIAWDDEAARAALVNALVADAHRLLGGLPELERDAKQSEALALLALIARTSNGSTARTRQRVGRGGSPVGSPPTGSSGYTTRTLGTPTRGSPAARTGSRHTSRSRQRPGWSPTAGWARPAETAPATPRVGIELLAIEPQPVEVLADSAYGTGAMLAELRDAEHIATIKPWPLRHPIPGGFTTSDFPVDEVARTITCPAGQTVTFTPVKRSAKFGRRCAGCPLRERCTTSSAGRTVLLHQHDASQQAHRMRFADPAVLATTDSTGPWSNAASPGSPAATVGSATAAPSRTTPGSTTALPR